MPRRDGMGTLEYIAWFTMHDLRDYVSLSTKCNIQAAEDSSLQLSSPSAIPAGTAHPLMKLTSQSKSCARPSDRRRSGPAF
jgi:hypothetical protein